MFFAIVFIVLGILLFLSAMGFTINVWGYFWALVFLAVGIKMIMRQDGCPMCMGSMWKDKMMGKMHDHNCDCDHECEEKHHTAKKVK